MSSVIMLLPSSTILLPPSVRTCKGTTRSGGERWEGLALSSLQPWRTRVHSISFARKVPAKSILCAAAMNATCSAGQTQTVQRKSSSGTNTPSKSNTKEKVKGPKLDDGGTGFPPFRFGRGGGGGGGGGSSSSGGFFLFVCVLLLDYLKEFEKDLQHRANSRGDDYNEHLLQP